jgi:hypothetical protein
VLYVVTFSSIDETIGEADALLGANTRDCIVTIASIYVAVASFNSAVCLANASD